MAHRILHQISSNIPKPPILKGHISIRSTSPQIEKLINRNLAYSGPQFAAKQTTSQYLSCSTPNILQFSINTNFSGNRKCLHYIDNDNLIEDEKPHVQLVHEELQENASEALDDQYFSRFEKFLNDSNYPGQSAKEFDLNQKTQTTYGRPPGLQLNEEIVNILRARTEYRRPNRRIDVEEVVHQADIKYKTALRRMHKISQNIDTDLYIINVQPSSTTFPNRASIKNSEMVLYHEINNTLQPSKLNPFGYIDRSKQNEKYKSIKIITKPKIELPEMVQTDVPVKMNKSKMRSRNIKRVQMQYNALEQRGESDKFPDQLKILEPNYEPQKRYKSPIRNADHIYDTKENENIKLNSHTNIRACQSIISQLKDLNPDYITPSIIKKNLTDSELIRSTANVIDNYQKAVLNNPIDIVNDILHNKIKPHHPKYASQKKVPTKKISPAVPIRVRVGSKLNLQQSSVSSKNYYIADTKSNPSEKILVPWPSLSDRKKYKMPNSSTYTDLNKNTSILYIPMNTNISKNGKFKLSYTSKKPIEVFLPNNRAFSTKTQMKLNIPETDKMKKLDNIPKCLRNEKCSISSIDQIYLPNKTKFEFKNKASSKGIPKAHNISTTESKLTSKVKIFGKEVIKGVQCKSTTQAANFTSEDLTLIRNTKSLPRTKDVSACTQRNITVQKENSSPPINTNEEEKYLSMHTTSKILHSSRSFGDTQQKVNLVGNNISTAKIKIPLQKLVTSVLKAPLKSIPNKRSSSDRLIVKNAKLIENNDFRDELLNIKLDNTSNNAAIATIKKIEVDINKTNIKHIQFERNKKSESEKLNIKLQYTGPTKTRQQGANRIVKKYVNCKPNNEQSPSIPIIGNIKEIKNVSSTSKLSSYSAISLKKTPSKTTNIDSNITNSIVGSNGILGAKQKNANKIIPIKRDRKTIDSLLSSEEKDINIKLRKPPQFMLKEISLFDNPHGQLKIQNSENRSNLEKQDELRISMKHNGTSITNDDINNTIISKQPSSENVCIVSEKKYIADTTEENTKRICVNLSFNPNETESKYTAGKSDKRFFNICTNNMVKRRFNMASTTFPMNGVTVMKNNFAPFYRTYCSKYQPSADGMKRVRMKRLKKRPGYKDDFPFSSNWAEINKCKRICESTTCVKIDDKLRYEDKLKKKTLPLLKRSYYPPVVTADLDSVSNGTIRKGPSLRPGYVFNYERTCIPMPDVKELCRADSKDEPEVKKKKLPVIYPRKRKFSNFSEKTLLSEDNCTSVNSNKCMHTTILSYRQYMKNSNKIEGKYSVHLKNNKLTYTNLQNNPSKDPKSSKFTMAPKLICSKSALSPYISYSEYKISKPQLEPPLLDSEKTPDYLQPKCSMLRPSFSLEPPPPKNINIAVKHEENFTKILKPRIKDLNEFAIAIATGVQCKSSHVEEYQSYHKPAAKNKSCGTWSLKTKPSSSSIIGIRSEPTFKNMKPLEQDNEDDKEKHSNTSLGHQIELAKEIYKYSIPTGELLNSSLKEEFEQNLKSSLNQLANAELISSVIKMKYKNSITNLCKKIDNPLFEHANSKCGQNLVNKDLSESYSNAIIPCDVSTHKEYNNAEAPSLWDRITNYFKAKLDYTNMQEKKIKTDLLLCSGDENNKMKSKDSNKVQFNANNDIIDDNHMVQDVDVEISKCDHSSKKSFYGNCDSDSPEVKWTSTNPFQIFSKEYDTFLQTIKERENESKTKFINKGDSERKPLKAYTDDSTRLLKNRRAFSTFSLESRAYSTRSPKTATDLLEYFNKIQNEKTSNIDENELTNNILTAIKVGMEVIKKSKLTHFNDPYFDMFKQLDTISKVELQSIHSNKDDIYDPFLWPTEDKANLPNMKDIHVANTIQPFCKNGNDIQNYNVLDYEESERKKTEDLQQILDQILKQNAEA